jgi:hypothetical protein
MIHYVGISFGEHIVCSSFLLTKGSLHLYAAQHYTTSSLIELSLYNYQEILTIIETFLATYQIKKAFLIFSLQGSSLKESLIHPSQVLPQDYDGYMWQDYPLNQVLLYRVGIPQHLLFQYHLLMTQSRFTVLALTTSFISAFYTYKKHFSAVPSLSLDDLKTLFYTQDYLSLLAFDKYKKQLDKKDLIEAFGLYCVAQEVYETN